MTDAVVFLILWALAALYYYRRYKHPPRPDRPTWRKAIGGTARVVAEVFFAFMFVAFICVELGLDRWVSPPATWVLILAVYVGQRWLWLRTRPTAETPSLDAEALHV